MSSYVLNTCTRSVYSYGEAIDARAIRGLSLEEGRRSAASGGHGSSSGEGILLKRGFERAAPAEVVV